MAELPYRCVDDSEARLLVFAGHTQVPVELLDADGNVVFENPAFVHTFLPGPRSESKRLSSVISKLVPAGMAPREWLCGMKGEGLFKAEALLSTASGTREWFRVTGFSFQAPAPQAWDFVILYENIHGEIDDRKALDRQQDLLAIRSRQAQMGELLSMIAHQWRQPLTVVMSLIGNIQMKASLGTLEPGYLNAKLDRIASTVQFLSETIDSFRNFYIPTKSKVEEDLAVLTNRALELLGPSLQSLGIQVDLQIPEEPVKALVYTGELIQVALELITNARDALVVNQKRPVLRIQVLQEESLGILRVENNGGEIPVEIFPFIFDPYYTTKGGETGTGLGLYMSKLIVENHHGGRLAAASGDGWTSFTCAIPLEPGR